VRALRAEAKRNGSEHISGPKKTLPLFWPDRSIEPTLGLAECVRGGLGRLPPSPLFSCYAAHSAHAGNLLGTHVFSYSPFLAASLARCHGARCGSRCGASERPHGLRWRRGEASHSGHSDSSCGCVFCCHQHFSTALTPFLRRALSGVIAPPPDIRSIVVRSERE